jgi:hypothetical protein
MEDKLRLLKGQGATFPSVITKESLTGHLFPLQLWTRRVLLHPNRQYSLLGSQNADADLMDDPNRL